MAKKPKCQHCEAAILQEESIWLHVWNRQTQCLKMTTRAPLGSFASPRPEK